PDLADFVHKHGGFGELRIAQKRVQERRFSGAEETRDDRQRNRLRRSLRTGRLLAHCALSETAVGCAVSASRTFGLRLRGSGIPSDIAARSAAESDGFSGSGFGATAGATT